MYAKFAKLANHCKKLNINIFQEKKKITKRLYLLLQATNTAMDEDGKQFGYGEDAKSRM